MGLDAVELVLATEDEFGISIPDGDAAIIRTPRMLAEYVSSRLAAEGRDNSSQCVSQTQFYRLRAFLVERFGLERKAINPSSAFKDLQTPSPSLYWAALKSEIGTHGMPSLIPKRPIGLLLKAMPIFAALSLLLAGSQWIAALIAPLFVWIISMRLATRLATELPSSIKLISDLVPFIRVPEIQSIPPDEVLKRVLKITSEQLDIPLENIQPDHDFVKDLGMD
jgi:acyl carrier protein